MRKRHVAPILIWVIIVLVTLACGRGGDSRSDIPSPPSGTIPVSETAAERLKRNFNQAMQEASDNNEFRLRVTDEEITSLVALNIEEQADVPLSNPQVWFTAGRIHITGDVNAAGPVRLKSLIVLIPVVNDGIVQAKVEEAQMGPFDFPTGALDTITETINEALIDAQLDLEITRLEILEGELFIIGNRS
ncbi:MAG: hypothetical protein ACE5H9_10760 [Anaerolineae bacterium]